ncbi:hypothetical protein C0J52_02453 [Blattella germanica]|nr:hypothetical protein C0J52_02453 [Blattella germanica]
MFCIEQKGWKLASDDTIELMSETFFIEDIRTEELFIEDIRTQELWERRWRKQHKFYTTSLTHCPLAISTPHACHMLANRHLNARGHLMLYTNRNNVFSAVCKDNLVK